MATVEKIRRDIEKTKEKITNLGKYNEGDLVGEWVKFPTTPEEMQKVFERIGIGQKDDFGQPYEEWFITDYDCYVDGLYDKLGEYESLDELNYLASKLDEMSQGEYEQFQAAMEIGDHSGSLQEIINLTENLDCYDIYPDIHDHDDLGRYYIEELDAMQVPEHLRNYIDYEAYGRDVALEEGGEFTDLGYVRDTGSSFHEYYDGEHGSIPEEYRVMTFQDAEELTEEEKSEWAMDIAYDMDEFFRQHDPQYAAEHPEEHAAKEEIYENLMAGRISALDEKLAALGQTQEDYLPSEIEKFKDATGYEEFLDFDPAVIKAALEDLDKSHADEIAAMIVGSPAEICQHPEGRQHIGIGLHIRTVKIGVCIRVMKNPPLPHKMGEKAVYLPFLSGIQFQKLLMLDTAVGGNIPKQRGSFFSVDLFSGFHGLCTPLYAISTH